MEIDNNLIVRINELASLAKTRTLSDSEEKERQELRQEYLKAFRANFKNQLLNVKVVDKEGIDVTPDKLKEEKKKVGN